MTKRSMTVETTAPSSATVSPQVSTSSPAGKVVVAQSDFERALTAIDSAIEAKLMSENQSDKSPAQGGETIQNNDTTTNEHEGNKPDSCQDAFFKQIQNSLKERLHQIAQPIDDEAFHKRYRGPIIQEQIEEEQEEETRLQEEEDAIIQAQDEAARLAETTQGDYDYDEQELLDQDELERAREFRREVRDKAARLKQKQESVLGRAILLAQREIRLLTEDILLEEMKSENAIEEESKAAHVEAYATRRKLLQQMEESLQSLTDSLHQTVDEALPKNLRDFKQTMQVVEKSLERNEQPESLSQTEQAILSRTNEGCSEQEQDLSGTAMGRDDPILVEQDSDVDRNLPEYALANFFAAF